MGGVIQPGNADVVERASVPPRVPLAYLLALLAVAAGVGTFVVARSRSQPALTGPFLVAPDDSGMQSNAFDDGEYGYIGVLEVLAADVRVLSVVPVDASGRYVSNRVAVVDRDRLSAQMQLYLTRPPAAEPVAATRGDRLELALRIRPACPDAAPVTAVRVTLTVGGRPAEQVVPLTGRHGAFHAERTRAICAG